MVRASATGAVDSALILSLVKPITLELVTVSVENKPASLHVVPLEKALSGISPSWCGRQMGSNSLSELVIAL